MTWESFYLLVFLVGLGLALGSFLTGALHSFGGLHFGVGGHQAGHFGGDFGHGGASHGVGGHDVATGHSGHHGTSHSLGHDDGESASPFNFLSLSAFLIWFGGVGYILNSLYALVAIIVLALATVAGLIGGAIVFLFLARVLIPGQTRMNPADYRLVGTVGRLSVSLRAGGTGEIVYVQGGTRKSMAARNPRGEAIPQGTEVVIVGYEKGIAYVEPMDDYIHS